MYPLLVRRLRLHQQRARRALGLLIGSGGLFFFEEHASSLEDMGFDVDRRIGAHGKRDRIAWTGVDLNGVTALLNDNPCIERTILDVVDDDVANRRAQFAED